MGKLYRAISADGSAFAEVLDAKDIVSEIERIHKTSAVVTAGLGRLSIAASLMGYMLKGESDTVTLRVDGGGPAGQLVAVADSWGNVKSCVNNPVVEIPLNAQGKLDVGGAVGRDGTLSVVKDLGLKEPYVGVIPLVSGEIAEDIASYYATSEQIPTVCSLGVLVNPDLTVRSAGGFLVQLLPFADEKCISTIEKNVAAMRPISALLDEGRTPEEIANMLLAGLEPNELDSAEPVYGCDCSRERTEKILISIGKDELRSIAEEGKDTAVSCHFCGKEYIFTPEDIRRLIEE
ncbi:Hsp33 family molecular chaperone HslO [uncultured Ruminococcus sp.]|uniref:Hsp33 family molecular chaperone HslO n=1 Tax=uncultured Ruminococcus sp. TaxID=165186 RepID=UPI002635C0CB|nr:Hsp33 family molecular chaperone HslO [uncultured Ruminococcus sp.]